MLSVSKWTVVEINKKEKADPKTWGKNKHDITIYKTEEIRERDKDGNITIKFKKTPKNITRQINETSKLLKQESALQKLDAIKKMI